jgi:cold shock CspA family protein
MNYSGTMVWWNQAKGRGVAIVGTTRYFVLASRILSGPQDIRVGDRIEFSSFLPAQRPDLLPVATGIVISRVDAPADALKAVQQ